MLSDSCVGTAAVVVANIEVGDVDVSTCRIGPRMDRLHNCLSHSH